MSPQDFALIREALRLVADPPTPRTRALADAAEQALQRIEALNSGDGVYRP